MEATRNIIINGNDVECVVDYEIANDGIGAYEYWGAKCFDFGQYYIEINDITSKEMDITDEIFDEIVDRVADEMESDGVMEDYFTSQEDVQDQAWEGGIADNH